MAAMPPETWLLDPTGQDIVAQHLRCQAKESRVLQTKVAQHEAQLRRQSAEFARQTPVLAPGFPLSAIQHSITDPSHGAAGQQPRID